MKPIFLAVFALSLVQSATYDLVWRPKANQKLAYDIRIEGKLMEEDFLFASEVHLHVKKVEPNGDYSMGTTFKNMIAKYAGESEKLPDEAEEVQKYNSRGDLIGETKMDEEDDPISEILARAAEFAPPPKAVSVGDKWTKEFPEDKKAGLPKATGIYRLVEVANGIATVSIDYSEVAAKDPTKAIGKMKLDSHDFTAISMESDLTNVRFHEGVPPGKAKLVMKKRA